MNLIVRHTGRVACISLCLLAVCLPFCAAQDSSPAAASVVTVGRGHLTRQLRIGGTTEAVHAYTLRIPEMQRQNGQLTLVDIIPNGTQVKAGDVLAEFDATQELQNARDAEAKFQDLGHQVEDRQAQNRSNAEQNASDLQQAEADLGKAELEQKKAPIQSAIDAATGQLNVTDAQAHVASLKRENQFKAAADAAALRVLELQRDQQKIEWQRALSTAQMLTLKAPLAGMISLVSVYHNGVSGPAQPGDQLYTGQNLLHIFDARQMEVVGQINEADGASLAPGLSGVMHLDAYPNTSFTVHFEAASPVASGGSFINPVRGFSARFLVEQTDPRLLPDLSCAIDLKIASADDVLLVPRSAVHFIQDEPYVTKRVGGDWREQRVELGNFNDQQVVIVSGVAAGDQVRTQN
ncbi:MAG TPA: HlyD family efflux transporter periplasmic adaptor subunit [Terriglobales bacterium]|nr:HlyD family efflux transporter periplasmic adaptor subunit [Terriglobales bacterium]